MKKIIVMVIFGTRPEAIKLAPVVEELRKNSYLEPIICVTAQHREMLDQVLELFKIYPEYDLDIMVEDQTPLDVSALVIKKLTPVIEKVKPDYVVVQGDTTTAVISAWVAFHYKIKVAHIEAGLRTGDYRQPFPEEMNRRILALLATIHFAPTKKAGDNLRNEGIPEERIYVVGNTIVDAVINIIKRKPVIQNERLSNLRRKYVLITIHRRENLGEPLKNVCEAVYQLSEIYNDTDFLFQVHKNPSVAKIINDTIPKDNRIKFTDTLDYNTFIHLMNNASLIMTDSGGIQEEATVLGTPTIVLRNKTERPEALQCSWVKLVGTKKEIIIREVMEMLKTNWRKTSMGDRGPFGDGKASQRIVKILEEYAMERRESSV